VKAAFVRKYGDNRVVEVGEHLMPVIGFDDMLVQVKAASVNPIDFRIRSGETKLLLRYKFPLVLGSDLSGVVTEIGPSVTKFKRGDEIFARVGKDRIGTFAEYAAVNESHAALKPANLSHVEAASIPLVGLTSWQALLDLGRLRAGHKVLIHAGSGGVGTFAIQLAKHVGASVATTVGERNTLLAQRLGAHVVIDYRQQRFEDVARDYDVVLDTLGGETRMRSFSVLKPGGMLVTIYGAPTAEVGRAWGANPIVCFILGLMHRKAEKKARQSGVRYEYLFMHSDGEQLARIAALLEQGALVPVIDKVFPLDQAREALTYCESAHAVGKVVIQP
jgi:NADPH:quinone reductase-like Zn-dependent oxidoreductase